MKATQARLILRPPEPGPPAPLPLDRRRLAQDVRELRDAVSVLRLRPAGVDWGGLLADVDKRLQEMERRLTGPGAS